jgi:competence protein ComEC
MNDMLQNRRGVWLGVALLVVCFLVAGIFFARVRWPSVSAPEDRKAPVLHAAFFAVGQGDATLLRDAEGNDILIDGGPSDTILSKLGRVMSPVDRTIELVVLTHPHADHVNGLAAVLARYKVNRVLMTDVVADDDAYATFQKSIAEQHIPVTVASTTVAFDVGRMRVAVLWPQESWQQRETLKDDMATGGGLNDTSVVLRVSYGEKHFLFMGDASSAVEEALLHTSSTLEADVLKVGHHGSKYSTTRAFLRAVHPTYGVIDVGVKNRYGHPTLQTLFRLHDAGVKVFRTDHDGDIRVSLTPKSLFVEGDCGRDPCPKPRSSL